jgi:toxin HigB-1
MALELAFATKALRDICESEAIAKKKLGTKVAAALKRRLSDFQSINSFDELPFAQRKKNSNSIKFDLPDEWELVVKSGHSENPKLSSGKIDWSQVTRLKITRIEKKND